MGKFFSRIFCIEPSGPLSILPAPSQQDHTIINLKILRDDLLNQKKRMNLSIEKTESEIKAHMVKKNKEQAIYAIKRKKLYEEYLTIADGKYLFIQKAIMEVEKSMIDKDLNDVMKQTNSLLKDIQKSMDLDAIEEMKDNFDAIDEQRNAFNNLFNQYSIKDELDDEYMKYESDIAKDQFKDMEQHQVNFEQPQKNENLSMENYPQNSSKKKDNDLEERLMQLE